MQAVVYARLSEDHERAESVPTQISNSTKYAERMGWEVVRVFKDEGRSGYSGEFRPGFEDMLKFLSMGDAEVLIARHHDRLTRNAENFDRRTVTAASCIPGWTPPPWSPDAADTRPYWRRIPAGLLIGGALVLVGAIAGW